MSIDIARVIRISIVSIVVIGGSVSINVIVALFMRPPAMSDNGATSNASVMKEGNLEWFSEQSQGLGVRISKIIRLPGNSVMDTSNGLPRIIAIQSLRTPGALVYFDMSTAHVADPSNCRWGEAAVRRWTSATGECLLIGEYGWPLYCLETYWRGSIDELLVRRGGSVINGLRLWEPRWHSCTTKDGSTLRYLGGMTDGVMPLSVRWGPLIGNTIGYVAALWGGLCVFRRGRGYFRRRRGRCAGCGYDLVGVPVRRCPECGLSFFESLSRAYPRTCLSSRSVHPR